MVSIYDTLCGTLGDPFHGAGGPGNAASIYIADIVVAPTGIHPTATIIPFPRDTQPAIHDTDPWGGTDEHGTIHVYPTRRTTRSAVRHKDDRGADKWMD